MLPVASDYANQGKGLKGVNWEENAGACAPGPQCTGDQRLGPATSLAEPWNLLSKAQVSGSASGRGWPCPREGLEAWEGREDS